MSILFLIGVIVLVHVLILLLVGIYQKNTNAVCKSKKRLDEKTVLVTGGTTGMGLEIAKDFAQRGARVIVACPFEEEGLRAVEAIVECSENENVIFKHLDLSSFESTRKLAVDILNTEHRLDILMNNAGVAGPSIVTPDGLNFILQVNYYSTFLLTILLLPLLKKSGSVEEPSRIVNTSSVLHMFGKVNFEKSHFLDFQLYANSKLYLVFFSRELPKRVKYSNVVINNVDPGAVGTGIFSTAHFFTGCIITFLFRVLFKNPWQGAQTAIHVALDKKAGKVNGEFFKNCKQTRATRRAYNEKFATRLWEESIRLVKLTDEELEQSLQ